MLCLCRWSAQDDDSMAWISLHIPKIFPQASSLHTLPYNSFALSVLLNQSSTSAYHVVALCASAHKMSREKWQHRANLPISVSERSISKCKPIMWCATRSTTGCQMLRPLGPSSSEEWVAQTEAIDTHEKTTLLR